MSRVLKGGGVGQRTYEGSPLPHLQPVSCCKPVKTSAVSEEKCVYVCVRLCACLLVNVRELVEVGGRAGSVWHSPPHCTSNALSPLGICQCTTQRLVLTLPLFCSLHFDSIVQLKKKKSESESISETMSLFCLFMSSKFDSLHDRCLCFVCFFAIEPNPKTLNIIKILLYKNESKRISHDQKTSSLNVRKVIFNIQCYLNFYLLDSKKNVVATFKGVTHDLTAWSQS